MTVETGEIAPKDAAVWALERLPPEHQAGMALARRAYLDGGGDDWTQHRAQVEALADLLRHAIEQCGDAPGR